ncbi:hypothetical protein [Lactiplantibacillus plantarum]|nr:hypothetical protein [Lactiplantibacillus plantarum]UQN23985.1 hypothetical protein M3L79_15375 [Lactiplantibacillus plantarum]
MSTDVKIENCTPTSTKIHGSGWALLADLPLIVFRSAFGETSPLVTLV